MRAIRFDLGGQAKPGDVVNVSYSAKRGGRTTAGHLVKSGESLADVAAGLAGQMNSHFVQGLFTAKAQAESITLKCADGADDVTFAAEVEHVADGAPNHLTREPGGAATVSIVEL